MEVVGYLFVGIFVVAFIGFLGLPKGSKSFRVSKNICLGYDQWLNTLLLGYPDETISSRAYKGRLKGKKRWTWLANILDWIDTNHTAKSVEWDEGTGKSDDTLKAGANKDKQT